MSAINVYALTESLKLNQATHQSGKVYIAPEKPTNETRSILTRVLHYEYEFYYFVKEKLYRLAKKYAVH